MSGGQRPTMGPQEVWHIFGIYLLYMLGILDVIYIFITICYSTHPLSSHNDDGVQLQRRFLRIKTIPNEYTLGLSTLTTSFAKAQNTSHRARGQQAWWRPSHSRHLMSTRFCLSNDIKRFKMWPKEGKRMEDPPPRFNLFFNVWQHFEHDRFRFPTLLGDCSQGRRISGPISFLDVLTCFYVWPRVDLVLQE